MKWATRPGVHVDRAACAWLIRGFIDPDAEFVFPADPADTRSPHSLWSRRNIDIATRLIGEGRMRPRGQAEIDQARTAGRWTPPRPDEADAAPDRGPVPAGAFRSNGPGGQVAAMLASSSRLSRRLLCR